jgi:hypothetical protein
LELQKKYFTKETDLIQYKSFSLNNKRELTEQKGV